MKNVSLGLLVAILICKPTYAADIYDGTLIDAHSQKGKLISVEQLSAKINQTDVDYTLLSFRLNPKKIKEEFLKIKKTTGNKVRYLIPTKLGGFNKESSPADKAIRTITRLQRAAESDNLNHVGFGEILVQHAPHDTARLKYEGMNLDLNSERISRAIKIVLTDNKPVILHVELNDFEAAAKKILKQLVSLGNTNPNSDILLMHMAQAEFSEAEFIIKNTKNVHFVTSHSDNEMQRLAKTGKSQTGWINLFDKDDNLQEKWANLMNKNPKRFVLALDNVFDKDWLKRYEKRVLMWRKALASLDKKSSVLIACGNANDYFKLGIECLSER
jgi:hypothetical protein